MLSRDSSVTRYGGIKVEGMYDPAHLPRKNYLCPNHLKVFFPTYKKKFIETIIWLHENGRSKNVCCCKLDST